MMRRILFILSFTILISGCRLNTDNSIIATSTQKDPSLKNKTRVGVVGFKKALLSANRVSNLAEPLTVRIEGAVEGSGVIVQKDGDIYTVITAWHVIKDNASGEEIVAVTSDGELHSVTFSSLKKIDSVDLGLLRFKSTKEYPHALLGQASDSKSGETIYVSGYPLSTTSVPTRVRRFTKGEVVANVSSFMSDGYQMLYSNQTLPGMSGGGVFDRYGRLIAIHGLAETDIELTNQTGLAVKTGTNQGIPILQYLAPSKQVNVPRDADSIDSKMIMISQLLDAERPRMAGNRAYRFRFNGFEDDVIKLANEALLVQPENHLLYNYRGLAQNNRPTTIQKKLAEKFHQSKASGEPYSYHTYLLDQIKNRETDPYHAPRLHQLENKFSALFDFKKSYEIKPDFLPARINAANAFYNLNLYNLAIQEIDKALEFDSSNTGLHILRGSVNRAIANDRMREQFGDEWYSQALSDYSKAVYSESCNDYKNAALNNSLIAGYLMIEGKPCARLTYKVDKRLSEFTLKRLDTIISHHENGFSEFSDPDNGYIKREVARKANKNGTEIKAFNSFTKYIQATFAKGMLMLVSGQKREACDLLEYTYGFNKESSLIINFELDSNLDNKSIPNPRFDHWNFDDVCNFNPLGL